MTQVIPNAVKGAGPERAPPGRHRELRGDLQGNRGSNAGGLGGSVPLGFGAGVGVERPLDFDAFAPTEAGLELHRR